MSRTCPDYQDWLKDRVAVELGEADEALLNAHLAECAACRLEAELLESAIGELLTLEEEPVPHHFYVYEDERAKTGWSQLLQALSGWQRAALATAAVFFVFSVGLNIFELHVSWNDEMLAFSFGAPVSSFDEEQFRSDLSQQIRTLVKEEDERSQEQLRQEFRNSLAALQETDSDAVERLVTQLEDRLNLRVNSGNTALADRLDNSLMRLYELVSDQRDDDFNRISGQLQQLAANDELQADQVDAVMASVVELAETASR